MKKTSVFILISLNLIFSQSMEQMTSQEVYQPEKKPNWNSQLQEYKFTKVVEVPGIDKNLLFDSVLYWSIQKLNSDGETFQIRDKDLGRIVGKGQLDYMTDGLSDNKKKRKRLLMSQYRKYTFPFVIDVKFKDEKIKYDIKINSFKLDMTLMTSDPFFTGEIGSETTNVDLTKLTNMHFNEYYETNKLMGTHYYNHIDTVVNILSEDLEKYLLSNNFEEENW